MAPHAVLNNTVTPSVPYQQQPVQHRQSSTANTSRPMTPKGTPNARNRASKKKEQSPSISRTNSDSPIVSVGQKDNASNDPTTSSSAMQPSVLPKSRPLPTSSQLRQMDNKDPSSPRPRGIISLPTKPEVTSPSKQKIRNSRTPSGKKAREGKGKAIPAATIPVEEDVFSANASSTQERSSAIPSNATVGRKPRPARRASEPASVISDLGGEDAFGRDTSKPLPEASRRKRRREKDKDKGGGPEAKLAPALGDLHIGQNDPTLLKGFVLQQPKRIGLQTPLMEDDDGESTISEAVEDISDDSGIALGESVPAETLKAERQLNPGTKLLEELRSLSQSAPYGSDRTSRSNLDDGYHSGSGYGSAGGKSHGSRNDHSKSGRARQGYQEQGDESTVWEMPNSEERGSGTDLTWQQSLLASPAQNLRSNASRSNRSTEYRKNGSPAHLLNSAKRPSAGRVMQGFASSKQQTRDHETFGTPLGQPLPLSPSITRKVPAGFATPVKNAQRVYDNGSNTNLATPRPLPHHTKSAPSGPAGFEMAKNTFVEELKVYAGPTFHNSPSADSLPAPRMRGA